MVTKPKTRRNGRPGKDLTVRLAMDVTEDTPVYYVNYAEVNFHANEFTVSAVRVPPRPSAARMEEAAETGRLRIECSVQLVLPVGVVPGLIRALSVQKENYENQWGLIKDTAEQ